MRSALLFSFFAIGACASNDPVGTFSSPNDPSPAAPVPDAGPPPVKRVFITDSAFTGDLDGLDGADEKCNEAAGVAKLGGQWRAWLSSSRTNAVDRIVDVGPWYNLREERALVTKETIARLDDIPAISTAKGYWPEPSATPLYFWTGSDDQGFGEDQPTCRDWTVANDVRGTTAFFMAKSTLLSEEGVVEHELAGGADDACSERRHLLCLEQ